MIYVKFAESAPAPVVVVYMFCTHLSATHQQPSLPSWGDHDQNHTDILCFKITDTDHVDPTLLLEWKDVID